MDRLMQKYVAALLGFGFMAVVLGVGLGAAVLCLVSSGIACGAVSLLHRRRLDRFTAEYMHERSTRRRRDPRRDRIAVEHG
jgi:hypothetical protein